MKKLTILSVAFAAIVFAACGGNKSAQNTEEPVEKSFEQTQIEASIKMHLDSISSEIAKLKKLPIVASDGTIKLTDAEKQVKPDYLMDPAVADNAQTLAEKYRILSALEVDKEIAKLYDMPVEDYDKAITKLATDINDPSFEAIKDASTIFETTQELYDAMNQNSRINFFWQIVATSVVEQLFVTTQNSEKFLAAFDDDAAANITYRIVLLKDAIDRLTEYDSELAPVAEAIEPLSVLNATNVAELKGQLEEAKEKIATAREALLQ